MSLYCLANARTPAQRKRMAELEEAGICCFCTVDKVLMTFGLWLLIENAFPYHPDARRHLLLVPTRHITDFRALWPEEVDELHTAVGEVCARYNVDAFELRVRSGDMVRTGGTVAHLHVHVIA